MREERLTEGVTLHLADCRDIPLPKNCSIVSDPPYGIGLRPGRSKKAHARPFRASRSFHTAFDEIEGDHSPFDPTWLIDRPAILWGANNYAARLPPSNGWLCWYKAGGISGFAMSEFELAWTNVLRSTRHFDHLWHGFKRKTESGQRVLHPAQKPVALMAWCIDFTPARSLVCDPYMGSGSTGVAAIKAGRPFIGIEINADHFETALRRLEGVLAARPQPKEGKTE